MNEKRLKEQTLKLQALQRAVKLIGSMKDRKQLEYKEAMGLLEVISDYNYALGLLDDYDYQRLKVSHTSKEEKFILSYEAALKAVEKLKEKFAGSDLFGATRDKSFESSISSIYQTFAKRDLYPSIEEKAANLLCFIVKNHSFVDGNDLRMVVANSVEGSRAANDVGVDAYINTCVNGMGERAGNADLVAVILAIRYASGLQGKYVLNKRVDLKKAWRLCKYASYAFGIPIPINQPGIGSNAFAHESGIHADGALKDRRNYELHDFEELGRGEPDVIETGRQITVGEYSGLKVSGMFMKNWRLSLRTKAKRLES